MGASLTVRDSWGGMNPAIQKTISPVDGRVLVERPLAGPQELSGALHRARQAWQGWRSTPLEARVRLLDAAIDRFVGMQDAIAPELAWQMGRPLRYGGGEVKGFADRARHMLALAPTALQDIDPGPKEGFQRFIRRESVGVVLVLAPWNYPYLTAVNAIWPALAAGNVVVLKHSDQTPLCAERMGQALADLPEGVFQVVHCSHDTLGRVLPLGEMDRVAFTGSVAGGRAVHAALGGTLVPAGFELGGKDPAYVRLDAPFEHSVESIVDGAFFNSGQSCCAVERVFVHRTLYPRFVEAVVETVKGYTLGDPLDPATTLGPVVRERSARAIREQVGRALAAGARNLVEGFRDEGTYVAPRVLVDVDPSMEVMREETFGPVLPIFPVDSDEQAVALMNDSDYGLTASIWSADVDAALSLGQSLDTGTVFLNRCDALDPALAWAGVKNSGPGATLSVVGYEHLTRPKSFHLRLPGTLS